VFDHLRTAIPACAVAKLAPDAEELFQERLQSTVQLFSDGRAARPQPQQPEEEWVSDMAVLALHVFFARTDYGVQASKLRRATAVVKLLPHNAAAVMCDFLLTHMHLEKSRQPESFCEGLIVLHYCGYGAQADQLMLRWHADKSKKIYPAALGKMRCFAGFAKPTSKTDRGGGAAAHLLHYHLLLRYLARARKLDLPHTRPPTRPSGAGSSGSDTTSSAALASCAASSSAAAAGCEPSSASLEPVFQVQCEVFHQEQPFHHTLTPLILGQHTSKGRGGMMFVSPRR